MVQWWGYIHTNGTLQVKRYLGPEDLAEAHASPFVSRILPIVEAGSREEATNKLFGALNGSNPTTNNI